MMRMFSSPGWPLRTALLVSAVMLLPQAPSAQGQRAFKDVTYVTVDGKALRLDLYLPSGVPSPPLLVWIHGGAWNAGTKADAPLVFVERGIALASVEFRQASEARFPAQVHDIKAAIRFLRANARTYGYRSEKVAIAGASSGGHLAALVGVTNGDRELEGTVGDHPGESSRIQAIVAYFGASNLTTILAQSTPRGLAVRRPALERCDVGLGEGRDANRMAQRLTDRVDAAGVAQRLRPPVAQRYAAPRRPCLAR